MSKGVKIVKWTVVGVLFVFLFGYITMVLWNWLLPEIFGIRAINFWQALGLLLLAKILFGGFRGKSWGSGHDRIHWKQRYYEKMSRMTPEEKDRFKARVWEKWCSDKNISKKPMGDSHE